jgi:small-conductance mechanosensitive channel
MNVPFSPDTLLGATLYGIAFLIVAYILSRFVRKLESRLETHLTDCTGLRFASALAQALIFIFAFILYAHLIPALSDLATAALAGAGVVSLVVGLAAQSTLSNVIAGISLVLYRTISIGDNIQLNTPKGLATATVEQLSLGHTLLRDSDGNQILVPNSIIASSIVIRLGNKNGKAQAG